MQPDESLEISVKQEEDGRYSWAVDVTWEGEDGDYESEIVDSGLSNDPVKVGQKIGEAVTRYLTTKK